MNSSGIDYKQSLYSNNTFEIYRVYWNIIRCKCILNRNVDINNDLLMQERSSERSPFKSLHNSTMKPRPLLEHPSASKKCQSCSKYEMVTLKQSAKEKQLQQALKEAVTELDERDVLL